MHTRPPNATAPVLRHSSTERQREHGSMLPVVDPHVRITAADPNRGRPADPLGPLRALFDRSGGCHLLRAVHVQDDMAREDALADVARVQAMACTPGSGGLPNGIVACCELTGDDVDERLDALVQYPNLRGVRPPARADLPDDLAPLARRDLVLELRADAVPIGELARLATARPDCRVVLDDAGPWHDEEAARRRADWHRLRPLDNVVLKLGDREPGAAHPAGDSLGAVVARAIDAVGAKRVMLASGFADGERRRPWHETWRAFDAATRGIPASRRNALFRTNAIRTYRL